MKMYERFGTWGGVCLTVFAFVLGGCQDSLSPAGDTPGEAGSSPSVIQPGLDVPIDAPRGNEWAEREIRQFTDESNQFNSKHPQIARGLAGNTYMVWQRCQLGDECEKSTVMGARHNGTSWGEPVEVSPMSEGSAHATEPKLAVDSQGTAHIIWRDSGTIGSRPVDDDIIYRTWDGEGVQGLGASQTVSVGAVLGCDQASDCPKIFDHSIAMVGDSPGVVFAAAGTVRRFEVFYSTLTSGAWSATQVSDGSYDTPSYGTVGARSPDLSSDLVGNTYIVWVNRVQGAGGQIRYRTLGDSLGEVRTINTLCGVSNVQSPRVEVDESGKAHLVWTGERVCGDTSAGTSIYYTYINGDGVVGAPVDLTSGQPGAGTHSFHPEVALATRGGESVVSVTWSSPLRNADGVIDFSVLLARFSDAGEVGAASVISVPDGGGLASVGVSTFPSVVSGDAGVMACWQEKDSNVGSDFDVTCTGIRW